MKIIVGKGPGSKWGKAATKLQSRFRGNRARKYKSLNSRIKSISLAQSETKKACQRYAGGTNAQALYHNISDFWQNLLATTEGTADPQGTDDYRESRIGTDIIARGMKLRFMFISTADRPNLNIMVYVYRYNAKTAQQSSVFWAGPAGQGGANNRFLDHPNTDRVQVLKKFVVQNRNNYNITDSGASRVHTVYRELYLNLKNQKIRYDNDTGNGDVPMFKDIGICCTAFDATNTGATDIVGYWTASSVFYFKDP